MSDETQLPEDIEFPTPPLRPDQLGDPARPGLIWLWQGYLAQQKVAALISQSACSEGRRDRDTGVKVLALSV